MAELADCSSAGKRSYHQESTQPLASYLLGNKPVQSGAPSQSCPPFDGTHLSAPKEQGLQISSTTSSASSRQALHHRGGRVLKNPWRGDLEGVRHDRQEF